MKANHTKIEKALHELRRIGEGLGFPGDPAREFYIAEVALAHLELLVEELAHARRAPHNISNNPAQSAMRVDQVGS